MKQSTQNIINLYTDLDELDLGDYSPNETFQFGQYYNWASQFVNDDLDTDLTTMIDIPAQFQPIFTMFNYEGGK